jgi:hypothetical protein
VANYVTLCLRLVVRIEELTLDRKVRQSVVSEAVIQTCLKSLMSCCALSVWQVERYALNEVNAISREIVLHNFLNDFTYMN